MHKTHKIIAFSIMAAAMTTIAYGSGTNPGIVATSYVRAMASGNVNTVMSLVSFTGQSSAKVEEQKNNLTLVVTTAGKLVPMHGGLISVKVKGIQKMDKTHVVAHLIEKYGDGTVVGGNPTLVYKAGKWLVSIH